MGHELEDWVKTVIEGYKVVIFSKSTCAYCVMAKEVFRSIGQEFKCVDFNLENNGDEIKLVLINMTRQNTYPWIFINGYCVGGGAYVKKLHESGELLPMLQ